MLGFCQVGTIEKPLETFLKVATTLEHLLTILLMSRLSHVKQMNSQPIQLTHESILLNKSQGKG